MSDNKGINPHVLGELLGDNNGKAGAEDILRSALHSMSTELMVIYHLFWESKIFENEDFPGDEVTEMIFRLSKRAKELSLLAIADEVKDG